MKTYFLEGSSMLPVFLPGGTALVAEGRPAAGDCAVYDWQGRTLLHRVLRISPAGAWLADDAGRLDLHFVPWGGIKGRALGGLLSSGLPGLFYARLRRFCFRLFCHA
jgi:hypothetical protein